MDLSKLEESYIEIEKKYSLPSFKEINDIFEIEKIDRESKLLLRVIRKIMIEKIFNSLNFIEILYNPSSAPRMYHNYIKNMDINDKKILEGIYSSFSDLVLESISLEVNSSQDLEASLIKKIFISWNNEKKNLNRIFEKMKKPIKNENKKEKTYFG